MARQIIERPITSEATYKAREVEGLLDRCFYRKVGFALAKLFARRGIRPAGVSLLGAICGITVGHLYYYRSLPINVAGMALHVCANALDNADGQLARLVGSASREGRVIDSLADHLVFISVYVHLALRCFNEGASPAVLLVAFTAGLSHAVQGAAADYYRTTYLHFVRGKATADLDSVARLQSDYRRLSWGNRRWHKFLLGLYLNFMRQQELLAPSLKKLREVLVRSFPDELPDGVKLRYEISARPMFKLWGLLMTNTRMLVLFMLLLIGQPVWFFWIEVTAFNLLLACLIYRQESMSESLVTLATGQ